MLKFYIIKNLPILAILHTNYLNRLYLRARQCTTSSCFAWLWQQDRGKVARNSRLSLSFLQILQKMHNQVLSCDVFVNCEKWNGITVQTLQFFLFVYIYIKKFNSVQLSSSSLKGGLRSARTESIVCKWTYRNNWLKIAKPF